MSSSIQVLVYTCTHCKMTATVQNFGVCALKLSAAAETEMLEVGAAMSPSENCITLCSSPLGADLILLAAHVSRVSQRSMAQDCAQRWHGFVAKLVATLDGTDYAETWS